MFHTLVIPEASILLIVLTMFIFVADITRFSKILFERKNQELSSQDIVAKIHKSSTIAICIVGLLCCVYSYSYYSHYRTLIRQYENEKSAEQLANDYDWITMNDSYQHNIDEKLKNKEITYQESRFMKYGNVDNISLMQILFPSKPCVKIMLLSLYLIVALGFFYLLYIRPTKSAFENNHPEKNTVLWLNILTGWTLIGWLVLLMWMNPSGTTQQALASPQPVKRESVADKLIQLKALRDASAITQEEFERKKHEILNQ